MGKTFDEGVTAGQYRGRGYVGETHSTYGLGSFKVGRVVPVLLIGRRVTLFYTRGRQPPCQCVLAELNIATRSPSL